MCWLSWKSGSLSFLELEGSVQTCNGTALSFFNFMDHFHTLLHSQWMKSFADFDFNFVLPHERVSQIVIIRLSSCFVSHALNFVNNCPHLLHKKSANHFHILYFRTTHFLWKNLLMYGKCSFNINCSAGYKFEIFEYGQYESLEAFWHHTHMSSIVCCFHTTLPLNYYRNDLTGDIASDCTLSETSGF
jgi:hypothetical protein